MMSLTRWCTAPLLILIAASLSGCLAATLAGATASTASGYWSYKAATAKKVEVIGRECLFMVEPLTLQRESVLVREDKIKVAKLNVSWEAVCKRSGS